MTSNEEEDAQSNHRSFNYSLYSAPQQIEEEDDGDDEKQLIKIQKYYQDLNANEQALRPRVPEYILNQVQNPTIKNNS